MPLPHGTVVPGGCLVFGKQKNGSLREGQMFCCQGHLEHAHSRTHVGQPIKRFSSALWWVLCHRSDPSISLADLNELLPWATHLPLLLAASSTIKQNAGMLQTQFCQCCFDTAARAGEVYGGWAEGVGGGRVGVCACDPEIGWNGRAARLESMAEGSEVLVLSFGAWRVFLHESVHQKWRVGGGSRKLSIFLRFWRFFLGHRCTWTSGEDSNDIDALWGGEMEETCLIFGAVPLSSRKVRSNFSYSPGEKSAVLTVATLLARNVFDVGGTVVVPQKCRLMQIGE